MNTTQINDLLGGRTPGLSAAALRGVLKGASWGYGTAIAIRNRAFQQGWKRIHHVDSPVISVGNITTGGTGKTPVVAWLVQDLQQKEWRPGILSRGYRSLDGQVNDEKLVLDALCPGVSHIQNPDRAAGARQAIEEFGCNVLVLDDGFQHRRLHRDLDIVLIDALNPWGYGHLLPRGLLREPRSSLRRADFICLTRADQVETSDLEAIRKEIRNHTDAPIGEVSFVPTRLVNTLGETAPMEQLSSWSFGACCAIGNPEAFFKTLKRLQGDSSQGSNGSLPETRQRIFPDHHHFTREDITALATWAEGERLDAVVVTRKDLVKLPVESLGPARLWALDIGIRWEEGQSTLNVLLDEVGRC